MDSRSVRELIALCVYVNGGKLNKFIVEHSIKENNIKSITLPISVAEIDEGAFSGCECLESISFPDTIKKIGKGAFLGCSNLKSVTLPKSFDETTCKFKTMFECGLENLETITVAKGFETEHETLFKYISKILPDVEFIFV